MATTIKLKNSVTTTNTPTSLAQGEVAINITDKKVWVGNAATTPIQLLGAGGSASFGALTCTSLTNSGLTSGRVTYATTAGLLTDSANLTFNGTTLTAAAITSTGVATFSAGTVSAPAITTTGDTNTGIFFPAADTIAFTEGGVESMRIDSSGNVGIGTSSPSNRLHVTQSLSGSATTSAGIVRIANTRINTGDGAATLLFVTDEVNGSTQDNRALIGAEYDGTNGGRLVFSTAQTSTKTMTERMRIDSSGNVGIGTTSPSNKLSVVTASGSDGLISVKSPTTDTAGVLIDGGSTSNKGALLTLAKDGTTKWRIGLDSAIGGGTNNNLNILGSSTDALLFGTNATERMRISSGGDVMVAKTTLGSSTVGCELRASGLGVFTASAPSSGVVIINRNTDDGTLIDFRQDNTLEGTITVSGSTVSYNGGHLSRWSQLPNNKKNDTLLKGTVMSNLDDMCVWTKDGKVLPNEQLNKMKVSDVEGDTNVAGVFVNWTRDEDCNSDDMNVAMTGDMIIRIAEGVVVQKGDLLMSAGDGTAKPQGDDIRRSKTVAKVTSNHVTCTYEDGSYCVPCVLMAC